jgi:glycosyltransferase involved in cell wall biosynthesis
MTTASRPRVAFVLERALGHVTHADNLKRLLPREDAVDAEVLEIEWGSHGLPARVPIFKSNWTVRAGIRARRGIRSMQRARRLDAMFVHTQVPAVLAVDWMKRIPTVVSVDATPLQYDQLGEHYDHRTGNATMERLKWRANRTCFERAAHIVSWSSWAKHGVIAGYGVDADKVTVIAPGVSLTAWATPALHRDRDDTVRILFVGGDLPRKGGDVLLRAFRRLREDLATVDASNVELHVVTHSRLDEEPGVVPHSDLQPGDPRLVELYHHADIFCLPTRADCLPMVLSEAGAAALPLVSTDVAGIPEIVHDGTTGLVVPVGDDVALAHALRTLVDNPDLRRRFGDAARRVVEERFNAESNARQLVDLLVSVAADAAEARP